MPPLHPDPGAFVAENDGRRKGNLSRYDTEIALAHTACDDLDQNFSRSWRSPLETLGQRKSLAVKYNCAHRIRVLLEGAGGRRQTERLARIA